MKKLDDWVGKQEKRVEIIHQQSLNGYAALMDEDIPASALVPPGGHWMYFLPTDKQSRLDLDGHAFKGDFLPPIELPRRMWAGGRLSFNNPLQAGDLAEKTSTIKSVTPKEGRTGKLVFVTVEHEIRNEKGLCLTEEHDLVFRAASTEGVSGTKQPQAAPTDGEWDVTITPDPVMLFRYSALTFNGHRIHYDREYCINEEGYPGLIVHGPLLGTLLMRLAVQKMNSRSLKNFNFRNYNPIFDTRPFTITGKADSEDRCTVWVKGPDGELAVSATAEF
ncbi:MaoC family dehydratase N-terminal domain-containing protein [Sneathiella sp.]|uniref:FAS1-like dehydratase domain-containing protein n=1 Tax=Sneathiella sp. TaxID=1964365 RepID=UPI003565BCC7